VPLKTNGPPPGTLYTTEQNYASFRDPNRPGEPLYYERPGTWRVGVSWENAPQAFPIRWGLFADLNRLLLPGEEVVVEGQIRILERPPSRTLRFFAGVIQEGVGYPGGRVGDTVITRHRRDLKKIPPPGEEPERAAAPALAVQATMVRG